MSSNIAISVSSVSKSFPKSRGIKRLWNNKNNSDSTFQVLQDISFSVQKGESLGIVGVNGSGKSTLLQIIAGSMAPTDGQIDIFGRVGAILELGAGFHKEFSGRENAKLGLQLMGVKRSEIKELIEEVKEFSGLGDYFDQPVRTYSSGMYVRLAFSVAASGNPDIMIVDEALAVGDISFQRKCYDKLADVKSKGGTLLFVSHDEEAIRTLTDRAVLLNKGKVIAIGPSDEIAFQHRSISLSKGEKSFTSIEDKTFGNGDVTINSVLLKTSKGERATTFSSDDKIKLEVTFTSNENIDNCNVNFRLRSAFGVKVYSGCTLNADIQNGHPENGFWGTTIKKGQKVSVDFDFSSHLGPGKYEVEVVISREGTPNFLNQNILAWRDCAGTIDVIRGKSLFDGLVDLKPEVNFRKF